MLDEGWGAEVAPRWGLAAHFDSRPHIPPRQAPTPRRGRRRLRITRDTRGLAPYTVEMMGGGKKIMAEGQELYDEGEYRQAQEIPNKLVQAQPLSPPRETPRSRTARPFRVAGADPHLHQS